MRSGQCQLSGTARVIVPGRKDHVWTTSAAQELFGTSLGIVAGAHDGKVPEVVDLTRHGLVDLRLGLPVLVWKANFQNYLQSKILKIAPINFRALLTCLTAGPPVLDRIASTIA
jgi:hypothetical protein